MAPDRYLPTFNQAFFFNVTLAIISYTLAKFSMGGGHISPLIEKHLVSLDNFNCLPWNFMAFTFYLYIYIETLQKISRMEGNSLVNFMGSKCLKKKLFYEKYLQQLRSDFYTTTRSKQRWQQRLFWKKPYQNKSWDIFSPN